MSLHASAEERAVVLGEVELNSPYVSTKNGDCRTETGPVVLTYPALVTDSLGAGATNTNTDDVGGRVEQLLGETNELLVVHGLGQEINSHGGDKLLVADGGAVLQRHRLVVGIDLGNLTLLTEAGLLLRESVGHGNPDTTSTATGGEAECSVRTPVTSGLAEDNVGRHGLEIGSSNTLTEPGALHLIYISLFVLK